MAVREKQGMESEGAATSLNRFARVLEQAGGEMPRALVRMPDEALEETDRRKRLMERLMGMDADEKKEMAGDPSNASSNAELF